MNSHYEIEPDDSDGSFAPSPVCGGCGERWTRCAVALQAENERLNAHLDVADRTMKCDGDRIVALQAEVERLRTALEEIVSLGTIESIQQTRIAEGALRGEEEK